MADTDVLKSWCTLFLQKSAALSVILMAVDLMDVKWTPLMPINNSSHAALMERPEQNKACVLACRTVGQLHNTI